MDTELERQRRLFEEWAQTIQLKLKRLPMTNSYAYFQTEVAWLAWQEAIKQILPQEAKQ